MAYSNTPIQSTYTTKRYDLVGTSNARNGSTLTQDQRYVNMFPERWKDSTLDYKKYYLRQRPGLSFSQTTTTGAGRGGVYFNGHNYTAVGNQLYQDGTAVKTLGNSTGHVGFTQYNGTYTALIVLDGIKGFVVKTDLSVTEITDIDFPTPHLPFPSFVDGYLFITLAGTDDIYNCDLEDPFTWTAGNFITAELYPDKIVALAKNNNYIYAIGEKTIEYFYDAAIASGSPLQRNDTAVQQMGCPAPNTLAETDREIIFVGTTSNGGRTVWKILGFEPKEIGTPVVNESLDAEGTNIINGTAFNIRVLGHKFYVLNLTSRTWVYDVDEDLWHEWSYTDAATPFLCQYAWDHPDGSARMQHPTNGNILKVNPSTTTDEYASGSSTPIYCLIQSDKIDLSSTRHKFCNRFTLIGDAPNSSADTNISIQWSDDDYKTWSTARNLAMNGVYSTITRLGNFRQRAWRIIYTDAYPLRLEGYDIDVNIGVS